MPPQGKQTQSWGLYESDFHKDIAPLPVSPSIEKRPWNIVWRNVIMFSLFHLGAVYGAYLFVTKAMWTTRVFTVILYLCSGLGITAGVHRLWSHKSYKAKLPLRILLVVFNTIAFQGSVIDWARDHRVHHKYSETDADPHNAKRGLFFSHVGWVLIRKHPEVIAKGATIDNRDLRTDPVLRFQKKYYMILVTLACFILPSYIPTLWGESLWNAYFVSAVLRYVAVLNGTWLINSAAHKWGSKPYDKHMNPAELKPASLIVLGECFHNFHHTFPWDYKTAELGNYTLNFTTLFIDAMAKIGWAHDLKTVSADVIEKRVKRTGDGSHQEWGHEKIHEHAH